MTRIAIIGAAGYTALELIKILLRHPDVEIAAVADQLKPEPHITEMHPSLIGRLDLKVEVLTPQQVADRAECVFGCLPHGVAASMVPHFLDVGCRMVDFSADYRLGDAATFAKWYDQEHPDPDRLGKVVYGLPELFREEIIKAQLVANPGCYPTSTILALAPLLKAGQIETEGIVVDSKSGVSGAGRNPSPVAHYPECNESMMAYGVGGHRHTPEIDRILGMAAGCQLEVVFTPHLIPMNRGILTTTYSHPTAGVSQADLMQTLSDFYADEPFVQVIEGLPATKNVSGTNHTHLTARIVRGRVVTISCIDNLIKGASGAAVQNFNLMFGHPETMAL